MNSNFLTKLARNTSVLKNKRITSRAGRNDDYLSSQFTDNFVDEHEAPTSGKKI